eukprot:3787718-Rhodomonas_salina.3
MPVPGMPRYPGSTSGTTQTQTQTQTPRTWDSLDTSYPGTPTLPLSRKLKLAQVASGGATGGERESGGHCDWLLGDAV